MEKREGVFYVGVDWGSQAHEVCVEDGAGVVLGTRSFQNTQAGLEGLCVWLDSFCQGDRKRGLVAIEVPHGPVVETLFERGFSLYTINPKQLDRFRDRFSMAGAKDDRLDARVLSDSLRTDSHCFRQLKLQDPVTIELREWSRMDAEMKAERVRLSNRIWAQLHRYAPHLLSLTKDIDSDWFCELWELAPTPEAASRLRTAKVAAVLRKYRIRKLTAAGVVEVFRQPAMTVAPGVVEAAVGHLRMLVERVRLLNRQIRECEQQLETLLNRLEHAAGPALEEDEGQKSEQRDVTILRSIPGIGRIVLASLLAEAPDELRQRDYSKLRVLTGTAPVTRRSGKSRIVLMRRACSPWLRRAVYHWGRVAICCDPISRERYKRLRARGHSHGRAIRGVMDRLLYVACTILEKQEVFDGARLSAQGAKKPA